MSDVRRTFMDGCVEGTAQPQEIDDFVDAWHEGKSELSLHSYLGMSWREYALWVEYPELLPVIVTAHRRNIPIEDALRQELPGSAGRIERAPRSAGHRSRVDDLIDWLKAHDTTADT